MFYKVDVPEVREPVAAMVTLNPAESRRLIAKAAVALPEVKAAMRKGWIIIARGITGALCQRGAVQHRGEPQVATDGGHHQPRYDEREQYTPAVHNARGA